MKAANQGDGVPAGEQGQNGGDDCKDHDDEAAEVDPIVAKPQQIQRLTADLSAVTQAFKSERRHREELAARCHQLEAAQAAGLLAVLAQSEKPFWDAIAWPTAKPDLVSEPEPSESAAIPAPECAAVSEQPAEPPEPEPAPQSSAEVIDLESRRGRESPAAKPRTLTPA